LSWAGKAYVYDDDGNLISDGASTFQWDERNLLRSIRSGPNEIASFQYDSQGRRTGKTTGSATTGFLYNGIDVVQELEGTANTAPVKAHLLTGGIDELFLRLNGNDGANQHSVLSAAHSTIMLSNAEQDKVVGYTYEPYGATTADATDNNAMQYAGRENDNPGDDGGLYYYRARYYIPGIARFISEDPIGWASGQSNNYAYVGGDPINFIDPLGLEANQNSEDLFAGFGDLLSFGIAPVLRGWFGIDGVNPNSGWYLGGEVLGFAATLVIGAPEAAAPRAAAGERALLRGPKCFPAGTMVLMADGSSKPIELITDGEEVLAKDPASNDAPRSFKVAAQSRNYTEHLVRIEVQDDAGNVAHFQATREHPVWVKGAGWKNAVDLTAKDRLTDSSGHDVRVLNVQVRAVKSPTFNLTIDSRHTFYVVDNGVSVLVHNTAPEFSGGTVTESQFADNALRWLGPGYTEPSPGRFLSSDGLWQVRFGAHEARDLADLHGHFEVYDVPASRGGQVVENMRVSIVPDPCP
jgi:RHS repeat-associated protein